MGTFVGDYGQGRAGIAYTGSRNDVWHRLGSEIGPDADIATWAKLGGLDFEAIKSPAFYEVDGKMRQADDLCFMRRNDNGALLGRQAVTDIYQPVQPREVLDWFQQYIAVDERFKLDVCGHFKGGAIVWATARWREGVEIAGDQHQARVLMTTTFDGSGSTTNQMCMTRVVCDNTMRMAWTEHQGAVIRTRHSTKFNADKVGRELAELAQSIAEYKKIGDAMAQVHLSQQQVQELFRTLLEIPLEAKKDDISTRKFNQYRALSTALAQTRRERGIGYDSIAPYDCWQALQAVTRYVDHDRVSINGDRGEKQFLSANMGSGDTMKGEAMALLMPRVRELVAA